MNTEKALDAAKSILARKENLLQRYPRLYTLKADIRQWAERVEELKAKLAEEFVQDECAYCGVPISKTTVEVMGHDEIFCSRRCTGKFCFGD